MTSEPMSDERLAELRRDVDLHGTSSYVIEDCLHEIDRLRAREQELLGRLFSSSENPQQVEADAALGRAVAMNLCLCHNIITMARVGVEGGPELLTLLHALPPAQPLASLATPDMFGDGEEAGE